jgi:hypothetical protein
MAAEAMAMISPICTSNCADCGVGTLALGEVYMVRDEIWEQAWCGRRKSWHGQVPGQEILCIACLEQRIGRELTLSDFAAQVPRYWPPLSRRQRQR